MPLLFSQCENRYLREEKYIDAFPTNLIFGKPDGLAHRVTGKDVFVLNIHFCCTRIVPLALCRLPMNMLLGGRYITVMCLCVCVCECVSLVLTKLFDIRGETT